MTIQLTTNPVEAMITRIERQQQRAERARQAELAKMNSERRQRAEHQLTDLFNGIVENILPLRAAEKPEYDSQGQFIELTWILGSHEYQLPPIRLTWAPPSTRTEKERTTSLVAFTTEKETIPGLTT